MTDWLLDTNVVIDYSRSNPKAVSFVEDLTARPMLSVVTVTEIIQGVRDAERALFKRLFDLWQVVPIDQDIATQAGELLLKYRKSHAVSIPDALIAATALRNGLKLATLNVKHFPMIEGLGRLYDYLQK